jgi:hypothetical protein
MRCAIQVILAASGILISLPHRMNAQHSAPAEPMAVVRTAFRAYEAKQWGEFTRLVHADALTEFRSQHLGLAEAWDVHSAEINEVRQRTETSPDLGNPVLHQFAGVKTLSELRALSPQAFLARYLEATSPKADPRDPDYQPPIATREVIGQVTESRDLVHVVYRVHTDVGRYGRTESIEVIPVKRAASEWQLMLNSDLSFTGSMRITVSPSSQD